MKYLYKHLPIAGLAIMALFFMSCAGTPDANPMLQQAQTAYQEAENDTLIAKKASVALQEANEALAEAQKSLNSGKKKEVVDHQAYMAQQRIKIARQTALLNAAQDEVKQAQNERQEVLIEARKAEAEASERKAKMAQNEAAQQQAAAEAAKKEAMAAQQKAQQLSQRIKQLEAEKTARGLVLTLGDVLFDVDKANLKAGGDRAVQKLAAFLNDYPKRNVMIEGYTDNTGSDSYNQGLSERRANAVRQALMGDGIAGGRIQVRGYGEEYPVASNNTQAGRQRNRRVEVVISDKSGVIPERGN